MEKMYQLLIDKGDSQERAKEILPGLLKNGSTVLSGLYWSILEKFGGNPFSIKDLGNLLQSTTPYIGLRVPCHPYADSGITFEDHITYLLKHKCIRELK